MLLLYFLTSSFSHGGIVFVFTSAKVLRVVLVTCYLLVCLISFNTSERLRVLSGVLGQFLGRCPSINEFTSYYNPNDNCPNPKWRTFHYINPYTIYYL